MFIGRRITGDQNASLRAIKFNISSSKKLKKFALANGHDFIVPGRGWLRPEWFPER